MSDDSGAATHHVEGVGEDTVVVCEHDENAYGPAGDTEFQKCPYCGGNAKGGDHRIHESGDEVFCDHTGVSTYRYCPGCGEEVDNVR